ncbi:hypothetical protein NDU88_002515 [Pleurodeles waltl]|uniref:Uncharacterized protein n=1 Tax=Pleurodeles waltl TaxID=8319 RepID=A0AAV7NDZ5_PLEWA|nr:hypothetical protein NDU88_002515 [Pleurodeles waltl]
MGEQLDSQNRRMDGIEGCVSETEDGAASFVKCLKEIEKMLKTVVDQNEDLEDSRVVFQANYNFFLLVQ